MNSLTSLDQSIIRRLFSYLPPSDKLTLALAHEHFGDVLKDTLAREVIRTLDFQTNFSVNEAIYLLSNYGALIKRYEHTSLSDNTCADEYFKLIRTYCTNLEELTLRGAVITPNNHEGQLLAQSKHLKTVKLKGCIVGNAACSILLAGLSHLQRLDLEDSKVAGKGLNRLTNLFDLNLKNCQNFNCGHLIQIFKRNRLKKLNIVGLEQITNRTLQVLVKTQSLLEKLTLATNYWSKRFEHICMLKKLKEVSMVILPDYSLAIKYMKVLADEHNDSLECLEVHSRVQHDYPFQEKIIINLICKMQNLKILSFRNCILYDETLLVHIGKACRRLEMLDLSGSTFTDVAIVNCLEYLENLRHLDISNCVIKKNFYFRLIELRREMGFSQPLEIYIQSEMDIASLLKSEEYLPHESRVWLTWDPMRLNYGDSFLDRLNYLNGIQHTKNQLENTTSPKSSALSDNCLLFRIDDKCLLNIIQYLSPAETLNLLLMNKRFVNTVKCFLNTNIVHFSDIFENFTLGEARRLLSSYGSIIRRLHIRCGRSVLNIDYLKLIAEFCTNLVELCCKWVWYGDYIMPLLSASAKTMEDFTILDCKFERTDSIGLVVARAYNLRTLIIDRVLGTGEHLKSLSNVTKLHFASCYDLRSEHFIEICRSNRLLELSIEGCSKLNADAFQVIAETQKDLKQIRLHGSYAATNMNVLGALESLEHIRLGWCQPEESIQFLREVCKRRGDQIKSLSYLYRGDLSSPFRFQIRNIIRNMENLRMLCAWYTGMSDEDLKNIVDSCSRLEILDVYCATELTLVGLLYPIERLKGLQHYDIRGCVENEKYSFYTKAVKIKKERLDKRSLTIYMIREPNIEALKNTKEFAAMVKYVNVMEMDAVVYSSLIDAYPHQKLGRQYGSKPVTIVNDERTLFNLSDLPDNCLGKIASYLEPVDRLKLASIHSRFLNSTRSLIDGMMFDLNAISKAFTVLEAKNLFYNCKDLIRRIRFYNGYFEYLKLIEPYSQYLIEIRIEGGNFQFYPEESVEKIFSSPLQKLQILALEKFPFTAKILNRLSNKNELQIMKIADWSSLETAINMHEFSNLKELYLENSINFDISHLRDVCENCKLKVLDLCRTICVSAEVSQLLLDTQNDCLEHLAISDVGQTAFSDDIAKLTNLKHVVVQFSNFHLTSHIDRFVDKLILYHSKDLMSLKVICTTSYDEYVDHSWFHVIEAKRLQFRKLPKIEIIRPAPYIERRWQFR